jgi:hypothetical protein
MPWIDPGIIDIMGCLRYGRAAPVAWRRGMLCLCLGIFESRVVLHGKESLPVIGCWAHRSPVVSMTT